MQILKQSTAVDVLIGPFVDSTDGYTAETAVSPSVKLSKNGQTLAAKNDVTTPVHDSDGYYNCELDATDTNTVGTLVLTVVGSSTSLPVRHEFQVVEEDVYDTLFASGGALTNLDVNAVQISGDSTAADNAEAFFDGTGYAGTNNVIPTVTTLTGHTAQTGDAFARLGAPSGASIAADIATVDTVADGIQTDLDNGTDGLGAIKADTAAILLDSAELQTDWANGGRLDLILDSRMAEASINTTGGAVDVVTDVTNQVAADMTAISGDSTASDNLEAMFDGTGYTDDTAPSSRDQVSAIGSGGGSALNYEVTADNTAGAIFDSVTFVGTQTNTFANTQSDVSTFHIIDDATDAFDIVYRIEPGATKTGVALTVNAYLTSSNDTASIQVYDFTGSAWETLQTISGTNSTTVQEFDIPLFEKHTAPIGNAEQGRIYVRFVTSGQSNPSLGVARMFASAITSTSTMGYENGSVWCDEDNGTSTGTTLGVDGTFANQSDDFDNAQTIADSLGTGTITIHPGNSVTQSAALQGYTINNVQATFTGSGGTDYVDSTRIQGGFAAGTFTRAGTGIVTFVGVSINGIISDRFAALQGCGLIGTITLTEATLYPIVDCQAAGATGITTLDYASLGGATVNFERWSGNLTVTGMAAGDTLNLHCAAGGDIIIGGVDGTVYVSGAVGSVTDNRTGSPTLTDLSTDKRFTDIEGATFDTSTDSLEAIRDRGDAAWTTGAGGTPPQLLQSTTIATLASQTSFTLTAGSADDDAYNDAIVVVTDQSTSTQKAVGTVSDYTGSTKTVTLSADPAIFTMAVGDTVEIIAALGSAGSAPTAADIRAEIDSNSTQLAAIVADSNELQGDWANGGRLDLILDATATQSSVDTIDGIVDAILVDTGTTLEAHLTDIKGATWDSTNSLEAIHDDLSVTDGVADGIKAVTDNLPDSGALTSIAQASALATVDTNVDAVLVDTGTTLPAQISGLNDLSAAEVNAEVDTALADYDAPTKAELDSGLAALNDLSAAEVNAEVDTALADYDAPTKAELDSGLAALNDPTAASIADAVLDEALSGHTTTGTVGKALTDIESGIITGAAQTGTLSTTQASTDLSGYADDQLIGRIIVWTSGACDGEATDITDYANTSGVLTFTALTTAPSNGDTFKIV